jgi:drug/metabolite transporter (DMT)-like permease
MKNFEAYALLVITGILWGTITVSSQFLTNLGLSLYEISIYIVIFSTLMLAPVVLIRRKYLFKRKDMKFFLVYGLIQALLQIFQIGGVVLGSPVAIIAFLLYTQPVYTIIFGKFFLSEKISKRKLVAVIITLTGLLVLLKPWSVQNIGNIVSISFGILGGIFLSLWIVYGRMSGLNKKHPLMSNFGMTFFALIWLIVFIPFISLVNNPSVIKFVAYPTEYWVYLVIFSFISFVLPGSLFYRAAQKVPASTAGVIVLLEPVIATLLASFLFSQEITLNIVLGGFLILLSNYLVVSEK